MSNKCPYCGDAFNGSRALKQHVAAKHGNLPQPPQDESSAVTVTVQMPKLPPGSHNIHCPLCNHPTNVRVSEEGAEVQKASSSETNIPDADDLAPELPLVIGARMQQRLGKKTLCIVGTHPQSLALVPWNEHGIDEFWGLNDGHGLDVMNRHIDNFDRWFQLHHRWRYTRHQTRHETDHWRWLQQEHDDMPIYMQRKFADVPNSVEYPLRDVCEELIADKLARGAGYVHQYFASTFAYALALMIYEKREGLNDWQRLELFGCELLQTDTEYFRQRPNIEWWLGYAASEGVQVYVPEVTRVLFSQKIIQNGGIVQYPGYMAYGYKSPTIEEAKAQKKPIGEDPVEENLIGAWEDYYPSFEHAKLKKVYHTLEGHQSQFMKEEYEQLEELEEMIFSAERLNNCASAN